MENLQDILIYFSAIGGSGGVAGAIKIHFDMKTKLALHKQEMEFMRGQLEGLRKELEIVENKVDNHYEKLLDKIEKIPDQVINRLGGFKD